MKVEDSFVIFLVQNQIILQVFKDQLNTEKHTVTTQVSSEKLAGGE